MSLVILEIWYGRSSFFWGPHWGWVWWWKEKSWYTFYKFCTCILKNTSNIFIRVFKIEYFTSNIRNKDLLWNCLLLWTCFCVNYWKTWLKKIIFLSIVLTTFIFSGIALTLRPKTSQSMVNSNERSKKTRSLIFWMSLPFNVTVWNKKFLRPFHFIYQVFLVAF